MKTLRRCGVSVMCMVIVSMTLQGQIVKKAQVGFRFLENPVSAEAIGRGGVGVSSALGAMGVFWNPALTSWGTSTVDLGLHHTMGIADIDYNALAATARIGDLGVVGISLFSMDYGIFYGTRLAPNDQGYIETGEFKPYAYAIGVSFSQKVSDRFSYGIHLKRATQNLRSAWVAPTGASLSDPNLDITKRHYEKSEFALDVGAYYDFLYKGIRFGATLSNISREVRYENTPFPLPFAVSFGATVEPLLFFSEEDGQQSLVLSFESRHPRDFGEKLKLGLEFSFLQAFTVRTGYMTNYDERGFTAGVGVRQTLADVPARLDYAYQPFGIFGTVHHFTLGFSY